MSQLASPMPPSVPPMGTFHLLGFASSQAAGAVNAQINGVSDQAVTLNSSNQYLFQVPVTVRWATALGVSILRARINTPTLRTISLPYIVPVGIAANIPNLIPLPDLSQNQINIPAVDPLEVDATNNLAMGTETEYAALWCVANPVPASTGPTYTLRASLTLTLTNGTWVFGTFTFDQGVPTGVYDVVGMDVQVTNGFLARLVFPGQTLRPGVPCRTALTNFTWPQFRYGRMGSFGQFASYAQPGIEIMGTAAGSQTAEIYIDVVKVA